MTSILDVTGLRYRYPGALAATIDGVSLSVSEGAMTSVVGPSGSGKSTLLRLVAGLTVPETGDVRVDGRSVLSEPPEARGMTMMFQKPQLFPHLDVVDNVAFAARVAGRPRGRARESARRYLDLVHLSGLGGRRTRELSGGQEQRVALARALAAEPEVLLLDEPFSALDTELRVAMHGLLAEVRAALGPTILMVTHDMAEAALADQVAVLDGGRVAQVGPIGQLYHTPASVVVARIVGGFSEIFGTRTAQGHRSALGLLPCHSDDGADSGAATIGPAVLLLRQETVRVTDPADPAATACGTVTHCTWVGARQLVTVSVSTPGVQPASVQAELALGLSSRPGDRVGLVVEGSGWSVPLPDSSAETAADLARS